MKQSRFYSIVSLLLCILLPLSNLIQAAPSGSATEGYTPAGLSRGETAGSYPLGGFDHINLPNGSLRLSFPVMTIGARGSASVTLFVNIEKQWSVNRNSVLITCSPSQVCTYDFQYFLNTSHWSGKSTSWTPGFMMARHVGRDLQACQDAVERFDTMVTRLTFVGPDMSEVQFVDSIFNGRPKPVNGDCYTGHSRGAIWYSTDGSGMTFVSDSPIEDYTYYSLDSNVTGNLMLKDGTKYRIVNGEVDFIRDRNGNTIDFTYSNGELTEITDQINRKYTLTGLSIFKSLTYKGYQGNNQTVSTGHDTEWLIPGQSVQTRSAAFPELPAQLFGGQSIGPAGPTRIYLPDGRSYRIWYNNYGEPARVDLPTGGRFEYNFEAGYGAYGSGLLFGLAGVHRRVTKKKVYTDAGATLAEETNYSRPLGPVVVVDRLAPGTSTVLAREKRYFFGDPTSGMSYSNEPTSYELWDKNIEYKVEFYSGETLIGRIERNFQPRVTYDFSLNPSMPLWVSFDPQLRSEVTTLADVTPNLVSKKTYDYDQHNNVTDVHEYDFGAGAPGPLIRRTHTPYLTTNGNQGGVNYATDNNIHIRNLPVQKLVYDASGNLRSHTDFIYDYYGAYPLVDRPGIVQHDGAFHTGYGARGNLTGVILRNPGGSPSEIHQHNQYDIAGNLVKAVDGRGIPTDIYFSDSFGSADDEARSNAGAPELAGGISYAFPTKVTNDLDHTTYTQYDYYLGRPVNSEDANGIVSSVAYNDALNRPTQSIQARYKVGVGALAEKKQTTIIYDDVNRVITMTSDRDTFNDNVMAAKSYYDDLGRTRRSAALEGSTWTIMDTQFDALGRTSQVSNPYRAGDPGSASPPPGLWTTTEYDAVSRMIRVTTPDGARVDTAYNGNQTTVTDQAGKKRRSEIDAAGRLVKVTEDPGVLNYVTTYFYDPLDNLRHLNQGGQERWFSYDALSRLIRARNPEQNCNPSLPPHIDPFTGGNCWSTAYSYDANGNLTQRIDARGVETNYLYDALNRNYAIDYINGSQLSYVRRVYDGAVNGKGRLQHDHTDEGGILVTHMAIDSYDALGRPLTKRQHYWRGSDWGTPYSVSQTYDLAGNVKSLTYPSGRTVNYSHDQAGRLSSFSGNLGGGATVNYANTISYTAAGQMIKERFGTNTPLYHNSHYNNRLQLASTRLGDSATDEWNWSRGAIDFFYGTTAVASGNQFANDTDNNGNLRRQITYVPLAGGGNVIPQQHDYTYDALNRISTVRERQRNGSGQWADSVSQAYSYDQWGNRTLDLSGGSGAELVWFDDSLPAGAVPAASGGDSWNWVSSSPEPQSGSVSHISNIADWSNWSPPPYSGNVSHQSNISSGFHQHQYFSSPTPIPVRSGGTLYAYIYIDPENIPQQVMLQWGTYTDGWEHRAYWGDNIIELGTYGTASRRYMGPLPSAGGWVRLEVPASEVGLEGMTVGAMAFTLYGGRANWDLAGISGVHVWIEEVWVWNGTDYVIEYIPHEDYENYVLVDDSFPAGAASGADGGDSWNWRGANNVDMVHQHYFHSASNTLQVSVGEKLFTWVYLDPANIPSEVMLQWHENGSWEHRAYWGANKIVWGVDETASRRYMGPLPQAGGWVKLEIPASAVGLEGKIVNGMAFTLYGGRAAWDKAGKVGPPPLAGAGPPINNRVYTVDAVSNRLTSVNGVAMSYDAAGNQTNDGNGQLVYDSENRLLEAYNTAGVRVSWYVYDAEGRRVVRTVGSQGTWHIYGIGGELLAEYAVGAAPTAPQKEYGYRNGQLLVVWDGGETGDRQLQWLVQDHLGSTRMVVDRSGSPGGIRRHDFGPFGEELFAGVDIRGPSNGYTGDLVRQKFGSKERDNETGLDFFISRYFSSTQGRYTSPDFFSDNPAALMKSFDRSSALPYATLLNPQTLNLYSFVENNPLTLIDPDGHSGKPIKFERYTIKIHRNNPNDAPNIHIFDGKKELGRVAFKESGPEFTGDITKEKYVGLRRRLIEYAESKGIQPRTPNFQGGAAAAEEGSAGAGGGRRARGGRGGASNVFLFLTVWQLGVDIAEMKLDEKQLGFYVDFLGRLVISDLNKAENNLPRGTAIDITIDGVKYRFIKLDKHFITTNPNCQYCFLEQDENGQFKLRGGRTCCD
jgi:RHS repeat-associated protein